MDSPIITPTTCRFCRFYHSEGRRGGACEKLNVPVRGFWRACPLAAPMPSRQSAPAIAAAPSTTSNAFRTPVFFFEDDPETTE